MLPAADPAGCESAHGLMPSWQLLVLMLKLLLLLHSGAAPCSSRRGRMAPVLLPLLQLAYAAVLAGRCTNKQQQQLLRAAMLPPPLLLLRVLLASMQQLVGSLQQQGQWVVC